MPTPAEFFEGLPARVAARDAVGIDAVFLFDLTGPDGGRWHATIADGACTVGEGEHLSPDVVVGATAADWSALVEGRLDPQVAFMTGRLAVRGNMGLAMRVRALLM